MSKKWETITFDQIRKGDRLRIDAIHRDRRDTYRGTASKCESGGWQTERGTVLTWKWHADAGRDTIQRRVVKAPKPEPLPTKPGSVIIVHECNGLELNAYRQYLLDATGTWRSGFHISTQNAAATYFTKWEHAVVVPTSTLTD